jgi:hypothetical protein
MWKANYFLITSSAVILAETARKRKLIGSENFQIFIKLKIFLEDVLHCLSLHYKSV